jgi:hypothetical protein
MRTSALLFSLLLATPAAAQTAAAGHLGPRTVVPANVACTDMPAAAVPSSALRIAAPHGGDSHEFAYRDDVVVLNGGTPQGLAAGQRFFARRFHTPRNGEAVSAKDRGSVRTSGWLTVIAADEHSALARVDYACDGVATGDYLEPFVEPVLPSTAPPASRTDFSNLGKVLSGVDRRESFGAGDFLSIDRGSSQGVSTGMRVAFYRDRMNGTPLVEMATGVVVEVSADTAKVVLDRARFPVTSGDYFAIKQ